MAGGKFKFNPGIFVKVYWILKNIPSEGPHGIYLQGTDIEEKRNKLLTSLRFDGSARKEISSESYGHPVKLVDNINDFLTENLTTGAKVKLIYMLRKADAGMSTSDEEFLEENLEELRSGAQVLSFITGNPIEEIIDHKLKQMTILDVITEKELNRLIVDTHYRNSKKPLN